MDWKAEAAAARKRLAAAVRAPAPARKTDLERLREVAEKYRGEYANNEVLITPPRPEYGRANTGVILPPKRPVEPVLGPFWVDHHGQDLASKSRRLRAGINQLPENTRERATMLAKRRVNAQLREQDEIEHIQAQNAFRARRALREGKWKDLFTATQLDNMAHGREPVRVMTVNVRSFF